MQIDLHPLQTPGNAATFLSWLINDGHQYSLHLPLVMPVCHGTPLHCVALSASHPRPVNVAIIDMRRILCPPTAPFIAVEIAPIVNFPAIVHGIGAVVSRHHPITAAYLNDQLMGATNSACGPACVITLLSHRQTRGRSEQVAICLLDSVEEARSHPGFRTRLSQHWQGRPRQRTGLSGGVTPPSEQPHLGTETANFSETAHSQVPVTSTSTTSTTCPASLSAGSTQLPPAPKGPPTAFIPFPLPLPVNLLA